MGWDTKLFSVVSLAVLVPDWWQALSFIRNALYCALLKLCAFVFVSTLRLGCLRRVFGPKRDELTGEWRKVHNEELNDMYSSPSLANKTN